MAPSLALRDSQSGAVPQARPQVATGTIGRGKQKYHRGARKKPSLPLAGSREQLFAKSL